MEDDDRMQQARAAAASTEVAVKQPNSVLLKQIATTGGEIGIRALLQVIRAIKTAGADSSYAGAGGSTAVAAAVLGTAAPSSSVPGVQAVAQPLAAAAVPPGPSIVTPAELYQIEEGAHWLGFAAAAYCKTPAEVISQLHEMGVKGVSEGDLVHAQLEPKPLLQPHFIIRDRSRKAVVISIRGTATLRDLLADMAARPIAVAGGAAHTGMTAAVDGLLHYPPPPDLDQRLKAMAGSDATHGGGRDVDGVNARSSTLPSSAPDHDAATARESTVAAQSVVTYTTNTAAADAMSAPAVPAAAAVVETTAVAEGSASDARSAAAASAAADPFAFSVPFIAAMADQANKQRSREAAISGGSGASVEPSSSLAASTAATGHKGLDPMTMLPPLDTVGVGGVALILQRFLAVHQDYRVVITGHSLGAGIASILTVKLVRIILYLRRQKLRAITNLSAAPPLELEYFLPPRPLNCWAYAPPACLSPELSALYSLSARDIEESELGDEAFMRATFPPAVAEYYLSRYKAGQLSGGSRGGNGESDWALLRSQPLVTSVVFGDDMVPRLTIRSLADLAHRISQQRNAGMSRAAAVCTTCTAACGCWPWQQAASTGISGGSTASTAVAAGAGGIGGASSLQPLTQASASATSAGGGEATNGSGGGLELSDRYSTVMQPLVPLEQTVQRENDAAAAAAAGGTTTTTAAAAPAAGRGCSASASPAGEQESAMAAAAHQTVAAQEAVSAQSFEERLKQTAVPEPLIRRVLALLSQLGMAWFDPDQQLVPPGRIYYVQRQAGLPAQPQASSAAAAEPAAAAAVNGAPASGRPTAPISSTSTTAGGNVTIGSSDKNVTSASLGPANGNGTGRSYDVTISPGTGGPQLQYNIRRVSPAVLHGMVLSPFMVSDHMIGEYRRCMAAVSPATTSREQQQRQAQAQSQAE